MNAEQGQPKKKKHSIKKIHSDLKHAYEQGRWNIEHLDKAWERKGGNTALFDFITIGTSAKTPDDILRFIKLPVFRCNLLVDVRLNPYNQYVPAWNEKNLKNVCQSINIQYSHRPEFGVPKEKRVELTTKKISEAQFFEWYDKEVLKGPQTDFLKEVMKNNHPAFLCTELGPVFCHRHRIAMFLEKELGLIGYDI